MQEIPSKREKRRWKPYIPSRLPSAWPTTCRLISPSTPGTMSK